MSMRLKAFGGWKLDQGTTKLYGRILRGKGVQRKKPNMFIVGSSTSATFVLPVRHGTGVALQNKRMDVSHRLVMGTTHPRRIRLSSKCDQRN